MSQAATLAPGETARAHRRLRALLRDFHDDYADVLDRGDLDRWPDFFTADCRYRVMSAETHEQGMLHAPIYCEGRGMLEDRIAATRVMVYEPRRQRRQFFNVQVESLEGERL
jgi:anthranilate 1,2-dioxygenase small subunit